ncbi:hypothetical protein ACGVWS_06215 [Enterobacteriaceae bacterium LUAb1]
MGNKKALFLSLLLVPVITQASDGSVPAFKDNKVSVSHGPFINKITLTTEQQQRSKAWKNVMQNELRKNVNFAGHYRLYLSKDGALPSDCGIEGWVCGWIIDKATGKVVSALPEFNGNSRYYSTIDNGTSSPDLFSLEFYPNSNLIWVNGDNIPMAKKDNISVDDKKCSNNAYTFEQGQFALSFTGECEIDQSSE